MAWRLDVAGAARIGLRICAVLEGRSAELDVWLHAHLGCVELDGGSGVWVVAFLWVGGSSFQWALSLGILLLDAGEVLNQMGVSVPVVALIICLVFFLERRRLHRAVERAAW